MQTYEFISQSIVESQVKEIIRKAGYNPNDLTYIQRIDHGGFVVQGHIEMSIGRLQKASIELQIQAEILR